MWIARVEHLFHALAYGLLATGVLTSNSVALGVSYGVLCLTAFLHFAVAHGHEA